MQNGEPDMPEKEIRLLNKEEVIIPITTRKSDKMALNKRNTAITEEKISALFIKKKINNVEKLIKQTSRDLEDIKEFIGRPYKKSPKDMDIIIIDIRKKLNKAQESIKNCDPKSIENISEIDILIDRHVAL